MPTARNGGQDRAAGAHRRAGELVGTEQGPRLHVEAGSFACSRTRDTRGHHVPHLSLLAPIQDIPEPDPAPEVGDPVGVSGFEVERASGPVVDREIGRWTTPGAHFVRSPERTFTATSPSEGQQPDAHLASQDTHTPSPRCAIHPTRCARTSATARTSPAGAARGHMLDMASSR